MLQNDVVYLYDGSFAGFLCCVFAAFENREQPAEIWPFDAEQPTLFRLRDIDTDTARADRVHAGIHKKLGPQAADWVEDAFYSALPDKEKAVLAFLRLGFAKGPTVCAMLGHPQVAPIFAASRALRHETHLLTGFVRFGDYGGTLVARITPKNFVLPYLAPHFCARFPNERFIIYDETHRFALAAAGKKWSIAPVESLQLPPPDAAEARFQALWQQFYDTIEVQARHNPRCRMTHMPKRFWQNTPELAAELAPLPASVRQAVAAGELTLPGIAAPRPAILTPTQASLAAAQKGAAAALPVAASNDVAAPGTPPQADGVLPSVTSS